MAEKNLYSPAVISTLPVPPPAKAEDYLKAYNGYVYSTITATAQSVAAIKLHLFKRKMTNTEGIKVDEILEHPALSLVQHANPYMTSFDLLEATQTYLDLVGEAFWVLLRINGEPAEIWPLRPDWVKIRPSATNVVQSYLYYPGGIMTESIQFEPLDVVHFKYFNPMNPYRGKGAVQAAAMQIDTHAFAQEYNRNFFFNSAQPGLILTTEQKLQPEVLKRFMEEWKSKFGGRQNSNKVAFLSGGFKADKVSQTAKEMDFAELQKTMRDDILAVFKVPKAIIGITDDVNRANAEATTRSFMERVVTPRMIKLVGHLNEFYLRNWEDNIFFDFDDPAPEDMELKLKVYESGLSLGWLTRNEVREQENYPPVEGGDELLVPFSLSPLGQSQDQQGNEDDGNDGEDNKPKDEEDDTKAVSGGKRTFGSSQGHDSIIRLKVKKKKVFERKFMMPIPLPRLQELGAKKLRGEIKADLVKLVGNIMSEDMYKDKNTKKKIKMTWSEEKRELHWRKMIAKTDILEEKYRRALTPLFSDQEKEVNTNLDTLKYYSFDRRKGRESSVLFDMDGEVKKFVSVLIPLTTDIVIDKGADILEFLGVGGQIDTTTRDAVNFLKVFGTKLIREINQTTREDLKRTLAEGLVKGEGVDKLKSRVESVFHKARGERAEMIARTEVLRATNFATQEAYNQSGIVEKKEWLTAIDERVCPFCESMDGKIIEVKKNYFDKGDTLTVDGQKLEFKLASVAYPPLHPRCRCTLIPVL